MQVGANFIFRVEHLRHFAERHRHPHRHRKISHKIRAITIEHGSFDALSSQRIGPIENVKSDVMRRRGFHRVSHRRDVRVEAYAGILKVENEHIDAREHGFRRPLGFPIETVDGQACCFVRRGRNALIESAADAVLGAEQSHQLHSRRVRQQIDRAAAITVNSSLIGDESNALPRQWSKTLRFEHINPCQSLGGSRRNLEPQMNTDKHR